MNFQVTTDLWPNIPDEQITVHVDVLYKQLIIPLMYGIITMQNESATTDLVDLSRQNFTGKKVWAKCDNF